MLTRVNVRVYTVVNPTKQQTRRRSIVECALQIRTLSSEYDATRSTKQNTRNSLVTKGIDVPFATVTYKTNAVISIIVTTLAKFEAFYVRRAIMHLRISKDLAL